MKNLTQSEKIFLIYSLINAIVILFVNEDVAFGVFVSWIIYIFSYMLMEIIDLGK